MGKRWGAEQIKRFSNTQSALRTVLAVTPGAPCTESRGQMPNLPQGGGGGQHQGLAKGRTVHWPFTPFPPETSSFIYATYWAS